MTRIGVLTGGGDVPGLNPCIKTLVYAAVERGYEVVGLRRGWAGLLDYDVDAGGPQPDCVQPLGKNDVRTIDRTGVQFIHQLRTSTGSHERIAVIELFGRNCGETSLLSAYLAGVDRALICEVAFDPQLLAGYLLEDKAANPSNYAMVTVSEGARMLQGGVLERGEADAYGHRKLGGIGLVTGELLKRLTGQEIVYQQVGYLMRSGAPDALDLMVAVNYANMAINLIDQDADGSMVVLRNGVYTWVPIATIMAGTKRVDVDALYDAKAYRPRIRQVDGKPMFLY